MGGLCIVKASPNRRGADKGGGEVNVPIRMKIISASNSKFYLCVLKFNKYVQSFRNSFYEGFFIEQLY